MSNISDYQALVAAMAVAFTDQQSAAFSETAKDATALKNSYTKADCPVRLLLPYGGGENTSAELLDPDETAGPNVAIRWTFSDVLLLRPVALGRGIGDSAYDLREYVTAYMTAAYALEPTGITDRMTVNNVTVRIEEAIGYGDIFYIGAVATWTVTEDDPPA